MDYLVARLGNDIVMSMYQLLEESLLPQTLSLTRRSWLVLSSLKGIQNSGVILKYTYLNDMEFVRRLMLLESTFDNISY